MTIQVKIDRKGKVTATVVGPGLWDYPNASSCIADLARRWPFPKPKDRNGAHIFQKFDLTAAEAEKAAQREAERQERAAQYEAAKADAEEAKATRASMNEEEAQAEATFVEQARMEIEPVENNVLMYVARKELAKQVPCVRKWSDWKALHQDTETRICEVWTGAITKVPLKLRSLVRRDLFDDFCTRRSPDGRDSFSAGPCGSFEGLVVSRSDCLRDLAAMCTWPKQGEEPDRNTTLDGDDRDAFDAGFKWIDELLRVSVTAKAKGRDARKSPAFKRVLTEVRETWEPVCLAVGKKRMLGFAEAECGERYPVTDVMSCYSNLPAACADDPCFPDGCTIELQDCLRLVRGLATCRGR